MSNLIAGLDWVAKHAKRGKSVVNLSLGVAKDTPGAKALNQGNFQMIIQICLSNNSSQPILS